jgi:hypothetical protein
VFDSHVGWPNQNKLGDYTHSISDNGGVNLAYAATFNGEQDVYFLRISRDCNGNGVEDDCDIVCGATGTRCDVAGCGTKSDCNGNDIPDECEPDVDCNTNGIQDICDIAGPTSDDCNFNYVPDECEPDEDCNSNGTRDICDIGEGTSDDCNLNSRPDECDIADGAPDDNGNGVLDECEGACCLCSSCQDLDPNECAAQGGDFAGLGILCADVTCSILGNDLCTNAQLLPSVSHQSIPVDNTCAGTDGPDPVACDNGTQPFGADIWYHYVAPCDTDMTVSLCDTTDYDAIMEIYGGGPECECPSQGAPQLACGDDTCGVGGGPPELTIPVVAGACYTIRVGGWSDSTGLGEMRVSTPPCYCDIAERPTAAEDWNSTTSDMTASTTCVSSVDCPQTSQCIDDICYFGYNRYLYVHPNNAGQSVALRVKHVASGATRWVSPATQQVAHNNNAPDLLTYAFTLPAGSPPAYADWPQGPLAVTGCFIVPGEDYEIQALALVCDPADEGSYSPALVLPTAIYGDAISTLTPPGPDAFAYPPQGPLVDVMDMTAVVEGFANTNWTSKLYCDLIGLIDDPSFNNVVIDVSDMTAVVDAFGGGTYPGMPPGLCP